MSLGCIEIVRLPVCRSHACPVPIKVMRTFRAEARVIVIIHAIPKGVHLPIVILIVVIRVVLITYQARRGEREHLVIDHLLLLLSSCMEAWGHGC